MRSRFAISIIFIVIVYAWLGYAMNVLHNPILAMVVYYPGLCLVRGWLLVKYRGKERSEYSTGLPDWLSPILLTIVYSVFATALLWSLNLLVRPGLIEREAVADGLRLVGMYREMFWEIAWMVVAVNPVFEELFWRIGIFSYLDRLIPRRGAIWISSLFFAGYHPIVVANFFSPVWQILIFATVCIGGLVFADMFARTRNIAYVMFVHVIANLNLMLIAYIYAPGLNG